MPNEFNEAAHAAMAAVGGATWCENHLEDFVSETLSQMAPEELTKGNIRSAAKTYIHDRIDEEDFAEVRAAIEAINPMEVGIYIRIMAEHMLELVINRG